jgi:hypothetical protein
VDLDIEAYAALMVELASAGDRREEVLARHGLDEDGWAAIDDHWQAILSEAMDQDDDGVPEILSRYAAAYEDAQRAEAPPLSIEDFARVTRLFQATGDMRAALAKVGASLPDYVRSSEHWSGRMVEDPELEARFLRVLAGG